MDVRLILQDDKGKHFTLPMKGVRTIEWETEDSAGGRPTLVCRDRELKTILELPADTVRTVYRDDAPAKPKAEKGAAPEPKTS